MLSEQKSGVSRFSTAGCDIRPCPEIADGEIWLKRLRVPLARCSLKRRRAFLPSGRNIIPNAAVLAAEKQKRLPCAHNNIFRFSNKDGMVAGVFGRPKLA